MLRLSHRKEGTTNGPMVGPQQAPSSQDSWDTLSKTSFLSLVREGRRCGEVWHPETEPRCVSGTGEGKAYQSNFSSPTLDKDIPIVLISVALSLQSL